MPLKDTSTLRFVARLGRERHHRAVDARPAVAAHPFIPVLLPDSRGSVAVMAAITIALLIVLGLMAVVHHHHDQIAPYEYTLTTCSESMHFTLQPPYNITVAVYNRWMF